MLISAAATLARTLMNQHGLKDWKFGWSRAKQTCGVCQYRSRYIRLSVHYVNLNAEPLVRNTILHEIAHAIAGYEAGHGPAWRQVCREVGCTDSRVNRGATMPAGKWRANCPTCDRLYTRHKFVHNPNRIHFCPKCGPDKGLLRFSRRGA